MNIYVWRMLVGFIKTMMLYLPIWITWFVISRFDDFWNWMLWRRVFGLELPLAGFIMSLVIFYLVGAISETRAGLWFDRNIFFKIPIIKKFLVSFNPQVRELYKKARGAVIARYQSEWRTAFLTVIHKTKRGCLGSVGYIALPPVPQQLDEKSPIKVIEKVGVDGAIHYELIPRDIAWQQELSFGTTVPPDAYKDVVEITFGELVPHLNLKDFGARENEV